MDEIPNAHGLDISPVGANGEIYLIQASELKKYDPATKTLTGTGLTFTGRIQNARSIGYADLGLPDYPGAGVVGTLWRGEESAAARRPASSRLPAQVRRRADRDPVRRRWQGQDLRRRLPERRRVRRRPVHRRGHVQPVLAGRGPAGGVRRQAVDRRLPRGPALRLRPGASPGAARSTHRTTPVRRTTPSELLNLKPDLLQTRARALVEVNGKIAVGTVPDGDRLGGALVIYDPATDARRSTATWSRTRASSA